MDWDILAPRESHNRVAVNFPVWLTEPGIQYISYLFSLLSSLFHISNKILIPFKSWWCVCFGNNIKSAFWLWVLFYLFMQKWSGFVCFGTHLFFWKWTKQTYSCVVFCCRIWTSLRLFITKGYLLLNYIVPRAVMYFCQHSINLSACLDTCIYVN